MDIFVINLASSKDRLGSIKAQLEAAHLDFTRISAVDGSSLSPAQLNAHYQSDLNKRTYRRPLSLGEIGCYLSHRKCWQQVVEDKLVMALILEDDAAINSQLPDVLSSIEQLPIKWDIIKLCDPAKRTKHASTVPLNKKTRLCQYKKIPSRATGYVVSHNGASKLLQARNVFGRPVDDDIQFYWEFNGEVFGIEPSPIGNSQLATDSDIDSHSPRQRTKTALSRVKAPLLRLDYEIRLLHHNRTRKALSFNKSKPSAWW